MKFSLFTNIRADIILKSILLDIKPITYYLPYNQFKQLQEELNTNDPDIYIDGVRILIKDMTLSQKLELYPELIHEYYEPADKLV